MLDIELRGGLGDAFITLHETTAYDLLGGLRPFEQARIQINSHNPFVDELFRWHPKQAQITITKSPHFFNNYGDSAERLRAGLSRQWPTPCPTRPRAPIPFYPSPEDREILDRMLPKEPYLAAALTASGIELANRDIPGPIVLSAFAEADALGIPVVLFGRSYRGPWQPKNPPVPKARGLVNLVDRLSVPGTAAALKGARAVFSAHSSMLLLSWYERKPVFALYPRKQYEAEFKLAHSPFSFGKTYPETVHMLFELYTPEKFQSFLRKTFLTTKGGPMLSLALAALFSSPAALQSPELTKAARTLTEHPDDPAANTLIGSHYALEGDWDKALPFLAKSKAPEIVAGLEAEKKNDEAYLTHVEIGDAWTKKVPKSNPLRQVCLDRASVWYFRAWPKLDEVWKMKLRERLARIYAAPVNGKTGALPEGWSGPVDPAHKAALSGERVHSGTAAAKLVPGKKAQNARLLYTPGIPLQPGRKTEVSVWVLSDGTGSADDQVRFYFYDAAGKMIGTPTEGIPKDTPVWKRLSVEAPADAVKANIEIVVFSKDGVVYADDFSAQCDGKELLIGGGF